MNTIISAGSDGLVGISSLVTDIGLAAYISSLSTIVASNSAAIASLAASMGADAASGVGDKVTDKIADATDFIEKKFQYLKKLIPDWVKNIGNFIKTKIWPFIKANLPSLVMELVLSVVTAMIEESNQETKDKLERLKEIIDIDLWDDSTLI